jgi:hypothetical protein
MGSHPAPRPPFFAELRHRLGIGPLLQPEGEARRLLQGEIAGRPGVGVAEAEQEINVGGPGPDAMQRGQSGVCLVGFHGGDGVEIDMASGDGLADFLDGLDLRPRQTEPGQLVGAGQSHRVVVERIERREQPPPDRRGACGRELLTADDRAQAGVTTFAAANSGHAGFGEHRLPARVLLDQHADSHFQIRLGVDDV